MNWWKDQVPDGLEAAIVSARRKLAEGKPLGFDIEPLITAVGKRYAVGAVAPSFRKESPAQRRVQAGA